MIYGLRYHIARKQKMKGAEEKLNEMSGIIFAQFFVCHFFCVSHGYFWSESLRKIMFLTLFNRMILTRKYS